MLKMNAEEARKEAFARRASLRKLASPTHAYNTGYGLAAGDAAEYIGYVRLPSNLYHITLRSTQVALSTEASIGLVHEVKRSVQRKEVSYGVMTPAKMVATVRNTFMLTVKDASQVFHVSRPTIYQWESLRAIDDIRARADRERMKALYRLSLKWAARGHLVGRWLTATLPSGKSVLDLLAADTIDLAALFAAHDQLAEAKGSLCRAEHVRSVAAVNAMRAVFEKLGANEERRKGKS